MASLSDFRTRFPEFACENDATVQLALDDADLQINRGVWRTKADLGQMYLTAHQLALFPTEGRMVGAQSGTLASVPAGSVISESAGDVSRTYANTASGFGSGALDFGGTRYGMVYLRLKATIASTPVVL